jgi:hypothetical protein
VCKKYSSRADEGQKEYLEPNVPRNIRQIFINTISYRMLYLGSEQKKMGEKNVLNSQLVPKLTSLHPLTTAFLHSLVVYKKY